MADFSDEQLGKRVVAQNGTTIGEVTDVRNGSLHVTVDGDADRDVIDELNWDGVVDQSTHELNDRHVTTVREDAIRLGV